MFSCLSAHQEKRIGVGIRFSEFHLSFGSGKWSNELVASNLANHIGIFVQFYVVDSISDQDTENLL